MGNYRRFISLCHSIICTTSALRLLASLACCSLYICARAFGPRYGGKFPLTIEIEETYVAAKEICHVMLALIKSESVLSNYPSKTVETTFLGQF